MIVTRVAIKQHELNSLVVYYRTKRELHQLDDEYKFVRDKEGKYMILTEIETGRRLLFPDVKSAEVFVSEHHYNGVKDMIEFQIMEFFDIENSREYKLMVA